jgi:hypothetical protein
MVEHDPVSRLALDGATWTERGGALSDLVSNPTLGLLAAVAALRHEFTLVKRKTTEAQIQEAKERAKAGG